jgi:hypothetical protein
MRVIPKLLVLLALTFSCRDDFDSKPKTEVLPKAVFTTLAKEPSLQKALDKVGLLRTENSKGRLMSGIAEFESDSILKVIQADSLEYSYTLSISNTTNSNSFKNIVFSRYSNGFLAYVLEYVSSDAKLSLNSFNGSVKKYNLEGEILAEVSVNKANLSNSSGRTAACFADVEVVCVSGGGISTATGRPLPCLRWETIITIDCFGGSGGGGGVTRGWYNLGTYIPDPYGGPGGGGGAGGGGGGGTPPSGDPNFEGSVGILPPTMTKREALDLVLAEDPFFLINIPCDQLPNWQSVALHKPPQSVLDKLNNLSQNQSLWAGLIPYYGWSVQSLNEAKGTVVNMDYYSVTINQLPGGESAPQLLDYIRRNINSFIDPTKADFEPFSNSEYNNWQSSSYLGSIVHIDMGNDNTWAGDYNFVDQPDDGSVICTKAQSDHWIFTTITAPGDGEHPVSGNRQFGYTQNRNGSYTFFTRGVDRATGHIDDYAQENWDAIFSEADQLWSSFQEGIKNYVNSHGGNASVTPENKVYHRPDWVDYADYLNGTVSISVFGCK